jgi:PilZ domain-containing protein
VKGSVTPLTGSGLLEAPLSDPRRHHRYPIRLDVEYKLQRKGRVILCGLGRTLNISSGGVFLSVDGSLEIGGLIKLAINWPFLLDGFCPLKLKIRGLIVRSDVNGIAVEIQHYEFRTAGALLAHQSSPDRASPSAVIQSCLASGPVR